MSCGAVGETKVPRFARNDKSSGGAAYSASLRAGCGHPPSRVSVDERTPSIERGMGVQGSFSRADGGLLQDGDASLPLHPIPSRKREKNCQGCARSKMSGVVPGRSGVGGVNSAAECAAAVVPTFRRLGLSVRQSASRKPLLTRRSPAEE